VQNGYLIKSSRNIADLMKKYMDRLKIIKPQGGVKQRKHLGAHCHQKHREV
jgi:hypothetical protein